MIVDYYTNVYYIVCMNNNKTPDRVQERKVRAIALQVVVISSLSIAFKQPIVMLILSIDFAIRVISDGKYSLLSSISRNFLVPILPFRNKIILMRPKKFAASIGMILSAAAGIFGLSGQITPMIYLTAILLLFSSLEAFLKFCAGCWMFGVLIRMKLIHEDNCQDCTLTPVE